MKIIESRFTSFDGTELFMRKWVPKGPIEKAIIIIHRGHEHSERLKGMVEGLRCENTLFVSWDLRGHGNSPGERGDAVSFYSHVQDLELLSRIILKDYALSYERMSVIGNSIGGVIASAWVHDFAPKVSSLILLAPAFEINLYVPLAKPSLELIGKVFKNQYISSYIKPNMLTSDPDEASAYKNDDKISSKISVKILNELNRLSNRIMADSAAIFTPTLILSAEKDFVVKQKAQRKFFAGISSELKEFQVLTGFKHAIIHEKHRKDAFAAVNSFLEKAWALKPTSIQFRDADKSGFTFEEYKKNKGDLNIFKSTIYAFQRGSMSSIGQLSNGISIGYQEGFDSGKSLEYVYDNVSSGRFGVGKLIDRTYLDAIGWKGVRQRKENLQSLVETSVEALKIQKRPIRVLDIAAGTGKYLLEILSQYKNEDIRVILKDNEERNVIRGRALIEEMDLSEIVEFQIGDAFSSNDYQKLPWSPNLSIISGLFELIPENAEVLKAINLIRRISEKRGHLIYTGQPWHPQLEMISRTLKNREGNLWVMRRRTQMELDSLVNEEGIEKIESLIGPYGIFTVSRSLIGGMNERLQ